MEVISIVTPQPCPFLTHEFKGTAWDWTARNEQRYGVNNKHLRPASDYSAFKQIVETSVVEKSYHFVNKWNDIHYPRWSFGPSHGSVETNEEWLETRGALKVQKWFDKLHSVVDTNVLIAELPEAVSHITKTATDLVNALRALKKGRISAAFGHLGIKGRRKAKVSFYDRKKGKVVNRRISIKQHKRLMNEDYQRLNRRYRHLLKRGRWKLGKSKFQSPDFANFAAEKWLELQYGWIPLIGDMDTVMRLAIEGVLKTPKPLIQKRISTTKAVTLGNVLGQGTDTVDGNRRIGYDIVLQLKDPVGLANYAFGVGSVVPAIWEAVPFSFVVDWFIPIGDWLKNISVPTGFRVHSLSKTDKIDYVHTTVGEEDPSDLSVDRVYFGGNTTTTTLKSFNRTIGGTLPQMTLTGIVGHASDGLSNDINHAITAISLLKTIFLNKG